MPRVQFLACPCGWRRRRGEKEIQQIAGIGDNSEGNRIVSSDYLLARVHLYQTLCG
jgi:hypothetical protein